MGVFGEGVGIFPDSQTGVSIIRILTKGIEVAGSMLGRNTAGLTSNSKSQKEVY